MNPFVKKEIRLLLPSAAICCALGLANFFFRFDANGSLQGWWVFVLAFVFAGGAAVMLALNSFGAEISSGTFSNLLAQPISRQKIWETKILLLAATLLAIGIFWSTCGLVRLALLGRNLGLLDVFTGIGMFGLVVFSGGLWTVLLLRQVAAAFWFMVLVPAFMLIVGSGLFGDDEFGTGILVCVLGVYSLAGFFFARWLFFRAQDVQWSGGTIVLPELRGLKWWGGRLREPQATFDIGSSVASPHRTWRPRAALFRKELQLHQAQFIMVGALALLHLGVLAARKFGDFRKNSDTEFILEIFWGLWLVMPMLVGAAGVAEERKLGTLAGQLCLPVKRRTQFTMKFRMVLLLSVLFGVVMPLLLEGPRIFPGGQMFPNGFDFGTDRLEPMGQPYFWVCLGVINSLGPLLLFLGIATGIGAISFYASTLARNTLQALAPAVLGIIIFTMLLFNAARPEWFFTYPFWHGSLIYLIGVPVLVLALVTLSFWNCQRLDLGWSVWRRNAFVLAASLAFIIVATTTIYHRAWEKLTPFEPAHGAAQLARSNPATLNEQWNTLSVRLPDGRIWVNDYWWNTGEGNPLALMLGNFRMASQGRGQFYAGSNWVRVLLTYRNERVGIKTNGTLWVSEKPARVERSAGGEWKMTKAGDLVRFGSETNWSSVVQHGLDMLLVKNDGTLWYWGVLTNWNWKKEWPGLKIFVPQRLGMEMNWAEVFSSDNQPCLRKTDGSVWTTSVDEPSSRPIIKIEPGFSIQRASYLENEKWRSTTAIEMFKLGVRGDGTFRIWADQKLNQKLRTYEWTPVDLQLGKDTNWLGVAGGGQQTVTLKDDGTLWLWSFHHDNRRGWNPKRDEREMLNTKPVCLGTHADWIAITSAQGGIISLAADGSLWFWPLENGNSYMSDTGLVRLFQNNHNNSFEPLLDISRKPQPLGNVFGKAD
jgi:ABC-type transport system involved in multi-copper enzyme maturation permease subunit